MAESLVPALVELSTLLDVETRLVLSDPGLSGGSVMCAG